ncbi:MAG: hypothetical protein JWM11_4807 [Planctomycetaceae bacterium]|nr:hypothetical protein [Planctomycetaceae bacterium]
MKCFLALLVLSLSVNQAPAFKISSMREDDDWRMDDEARAYVEVFAESMHVCVCDPTPPKLVAPFDGDRAREIQRAWAAFYKENVVERDSIGCDLVFIPPGKFKTKDRTWHERPSVDWKPVEIATPFYIAKTEVTQRQWKAVMNSTPWKGKDNVKDGDDYPATYVSWTECARFCELLGKKEQSKVRLPTEVEWEYCCRAGTTTVYSFGDSEKLLEEFAWFYNNTDAVDEVYAHSCGKKKPNPFGLNDLHGNVSEWCQDTITKSSQDVIATPPKFLRVNRGGAWGLPAELCESGMREVSHPDRADSFVGFRILKEIDEPRDAKE